MIESYYYIEHSEDILPTMCIMAALDHAKPIIWAQGGRYGWISREQVQNLIRRQLDLNKQQKGYAKDRAIELVLHWSDTTPLDPVTVRLIRETS